MATRTSSSRINVFTRVHAGLQRKSRPWAATLRSEATAPEVHVPRFMRSHDATQRMVGTARERSITSPWSREDSFQFLSRTSPETPPDLPISNGLANAIEFPQESSQSINKKQLRGTTNADSASRPAPNLAPSRRATAKFDEGVRFPVAHPGDGRCGTAHRAPPLARSPSPHA